MRPQYVTLGAGEVRVIPFDTNKNSFNVSVRATGATVEQSVDQLQEPTKVTPTWTAAPAAVDGIINFNSAVTGIRITAVGAITAVILQNGIQ